MDDLLKRTAARASRYRRSALEDPIRPDPEPDFSDLAGPFPDEGADPEEVIDLLDRVVTPSTMGQTNPRFHGWVTGSVFPVALAADWLTSAWDQNSNTFDAAPGTVAVENAAINWIKEAIGLPTSTSGAFVTGTTVGNATALSAGLTSVLSDADWDSVNDGLFGAPEVTVIVGDEVHPSLVKALGFIGLGRDRVVRVPVDGQGRMRSDAFPDISGPTIVCLQAGNVNTGAFDPMDELIPKAKEAGAWVHVDGAFGFWAAASPAHKHLTAGMDLADSWATDCHKYLNVPYDAGLALVSEGSSLMEMMAVSAPYLLPGEVGRDPLLYTPEMSRRARGIPTYAVLRHLGRTGLVDLVERTAKMARLYAALLEDAGFVVLNDVVLNQVLVSFGSSDRTKHVIDSVISEGVLYAGPSSWQGHMAMRISVSGYETSEEDVKESVAAMVRAAATA